MRRGPHPVFFFLLILPFGASFGYVAVALNYLAVHQYGVTVDAFATVTAAAFAVHGVKFLWAPVVDSTLTKKTWYLIALALTIGGTVASSVMPINAGSLSALIAVVMASQIGLTLMGMACENFLGNLPTEEKGRASGWYQAGNFVGLGVGGDLALELSQKLSHPWMVGAIMGAVMLPSALALFFVPEPPLHARKLRDTARSLGRDLLGLVTTRASAHPFKLTLSVFGITGILIALSPVGAGAAANLFPAMATEWSASLTVVARVTGLVGGFVSALGALTGGWLADRLNRRLCYALAGALTAVTAVTMAYGPRTELAYIGFTLAYAFFNGLAFACFSAFVLETIGHGAVATKYNVFASLANLTIGYMTKVDSGAYGSHGSRMALFTDAGATVAGIAFLLLIMGVGSKLQPRDAEASATPAT